MAIDTKLRCSTISVSNASLERALSTGLSVYRSYRIELSGDITASILYGSEHECLQVREEDAQLKVDMRICFLFIRLLFSTICETGRDKTQYTGPRAHCGGLCAASHPALTPNLTDNYIHKILPKECEKQLKVSPIKKQLLLNKSLADCEIVKLEQLCATPGAVENFLKKRLPQEELLSCFKDTAFGYYSNSTIHTSSASNHVDSWLETQKCKIRNLEDKLNYQCFNKEVTPEQGLNVILQVTVEYFESAIVEVKSRLVQLDKFIAADCKIQKFDQEALLGADTLQAQAIVEQIKNINELLAAKNELAKETKSISLCHERLKNFRNDYYRLTTMAELFSLTVGDFGTIDPTKEETVVLLKQFLTTYIATLSSLRFSCLQDPASYKKECELRLQECEYQLKATKKDHTTGVIGSLRKLIFGIYEQSSKIRREPTEREIRMQFLAEMTIKSKRKLLSSLEEPPSKKQALENLENSSQ